MQMNDKKKYVAGLSIVSNVILSLLKIITGIFSGSLSIISEAIHSLSDFFASVLTFFSVIKSSQPADKDHPYGHGKYEEMAGFIEKRHPPVCIRLYSEYRQIYDSLSGWFWTDRKL